LLFVGGAAVKTVAAMHRDVTTACMTVTAQSGMIAQYVEIDEESCTDVGPR